MPSKPKVTLVAAPVVRKFFTENPNLVPDGDKSVGSAWTGRGRLSAAAREVFESQNPGQRYDASASTPTITIPVTKQSARGATLQRPVAVPLTEFRRLSGQAKGRPSKASLLKAAQAYSAEQG